MSEAKARKHHENDAALTRRRMLTRVAAAPAVLGGAYVVACSGPGTSNAPPTPAAQPATIVIDNDWTAGDRYKVIQAWLERASRVYPHIKTELREQGSGEPGQARTIANFAADQQGDLVQLNNFLVPVVGPKNLLLDISPILASLKFDPNILYDFREITQFGGKRHGLLVQLNANAMIYNKKLFDEASVKEPAPAWTSDDYVELTRKLRNPQTNVWGTTFATGTTFLYRWLYSADAAYLDPNGTKALFETPAVRAVLQWVADFVVRHRVAPAPKEIAEKKLNFTNGDHAINAQIVPTPGITEAIQGRFQWDILPIPKHPKTGKAIEQNNGMCYLATTKAKQRGVATQAVQVLLEFFARDIQELFIGGYSVSSLPTVKSIAESPKSLQQLPPNFKKYVLDVLGTSRPLPDGKTVGQLQFSNAFHAEFVKALNEEVSVEQAAINMTRAGEAALATAAR